MMESKGIKENQKDKISVIIPFYKVEKYIRKCIDSVISQTYGNLEIILVDDGSPDDCGKICDEYARKDSRIKVVHRENGGISAARNTGIKMATGKYIAFVDGDDYINSDMYRQLHLSILQNDADIAICNFLYVDESGKKIIKANKDMPIKTELITGREVLEIKMREKKWWYWTVLWNRLYKKELFDDIFFPVGKLHEDEFTAHLFWNKCNKVVCMKEALYMYVQREHSIMSEKYSVKRMDEIEAHLDRIRFLIDNKYSAETIYHSFCIYYQSLVSSYIYVDKKNAEVKHRYEIVYREYKNLYIDLMKSNAGVEAKVKYTLTYISPYYSWKFLIALNKIKKIIFSG